jgi:hypothetical protein
MLVIHYKHHLLYVEEVATLVMHCKHHPLSNDNM